MRLGHIGVSARDPGALADFYSRYLGLHQIGHARTEEAGEIVFLSGQPQGAPPELQLMSNQRSAHVAFKVESLAELRQLYSSAGQQGVQILFSFDHGSTLSFYFLDPEGNACELYWETGRPPSANRPVDLTMPEAELLEALGV